ncbi:M20 family metallo-hydrolase [Parabacteroides sp. AM08-6]|uniref:M20 family metallo-hydrolase n=1 Tax=Parabacteroides sp. AM08-6 TaxID=2292053 RepID=UPI000F0036F1|nr:M20 family metallo-hydrolase [Parabacteroides sp. AM08-6]RHJ80997.1 M20/M25/M40 family metallo-hydrolase [Parabacteroides sp. AM08-6]
MYYEAIDMLKGMISRPSFSRDEAGVADFLQQCWQAAGYKVYRKGNNLWLIAPGFDFGKPTLLLNSHIDTVKPAAGWTKDPFVPEETEEELLYGLGSNDAGASVVSLYEAFTVLSEKEQPYNLIFLASCEEEVSGKNGLESVLAELPPIAFAVVGEPTGMQPAVAEKGLMVLDCVSIGKAGHAARNEGINAIALAMKDIEWFHTYQFPEKSDFLGPVKMSVTMIHAGTQHNVVPDRCEFTVDIRTNEFYSNEQLFGLIREKVACEVKARSFRLNSTRTDLQHPFVQRAVLMGKEPFGSPTLSDQALMPFPSVKIGPGNSARSHAADEYIGLMEIREAIDTYVRLLDQLDLKQ